MNRDRRKEIAREQADIAEAVKAIEDAIANLETIRDDEADYLENMPENMKDGDKGQTAEAAVESLNEAIEALQSLVDADVDSALNTAQD